MNRSRRLAPLLALVLLAACASAPVRPGAANALDSQAYGSLLTVQRTLEAARPEVQAHPEAVHAFNQLALGYNATLDAYLLYHHAVEGGATVDGGPVLAQVAALVVDAAALAASLGLKP